MAHNLTKEMAAWTAAIKSIAVNMGDLAKAFRGASPSQIFITAGNAIAGGMDWGIRPEMDETKMMEMNAIPRRTRKMFANKLSKRLDPSRIDIVWMD